MDDTRVASADTAINPNSSNYVFQPEDNPVSDAETRPTRIPAPPFFNQRVTPFIDYQCTAYANSINRPMTRSEYTIVKGYAENIAHSHGWGQMAGCAWGLYYAYNTSQKSLWPFQKTFQQLMDIRNARPPPNANEHFESSFRPPPPPSEHGAEPPKDPKIKPSGAFFERQKVNVGTSADPKTVKVTIINPLGGITSIIRYAAWIWVAKSFFGAGAVLFMGVYNHRKMEADDRLEEYRQDRAEKMKGDIDSMRQSRNMPRPPRRPESAPQEGGRYDASRSTYTEPTPPIEDTQSLGGLSTTETLFVPDDMFKDENASQDNGRQIPTTNTPFSRYPSSRASSRAQPKAEDVEGYDSPVADSSSSGGSAWDRIRSRASNTATGTEASSRESWNRSKDASQDSFSFSNGDRDRQLAKEEAQRDFDTKIERERQGEEGWK